MQPAKNESSADTQPQMENTALLSVEDGMPYALSGMNGNRYTAKFIPHPPCRSDKKLLRRTRSNPEGLAQVSDLPALFEGKTSKIASKASRGVEAMLKPIDYSTGLARMRGIPENMSGSSASVLRIDRHKKLERSQTVPVTLLKPRSMSANYVDSVVERTDEQRTTQSYSKITSQVNEGQGEQPVTRQLPNGRRIVSRHSLVISTAPRPALLRHNNMKLDENKTAEGQAALLRKESEERVHGETTETNTDKTKVLTYLSFARERQEDNRI